MPGQGMRRMPSDAPAQPTAPAEAAAAAQALAPEALVRAYHQRSKHQLQRYAAGPETLDWDAQPDPFRRYAGAALHRLPLSADAEAGPAWPLLFSPGAIAPRPFDRAAIGRLFELSFALAAWKQQGPDRWAVRCVPSSGNLHPTEAYLLAQGLAGLPDGLFHYEPFEHGLAQRASAGLGGAPRLWVGLSSIHWREAWKYGERAFRYCQLDLGHALGALRYAAAELGWRAQVVGGLEPDRVAATLGLDRDADFPARAEREEPGLLVELRRDDQAAAAPPNWPAGSTWQGLANRLDRHPMYRWPIIDEVAAASRHPAPTGAPLTAPVASPLPAPLAGPLPASGAPASRLIRQRRSAQRFDPQAVMPRAVWDRLLHALRPQGLPWDVAGGPPRVHLLLFAHRVEGLAPGAYALPRSASGEARMRDALSPDLAWAPVAAGGAPCFALAGNPALAGTLRTLNCHQALGSDAMLAVSMLAEWDAPLDYRGRLQEAGLAGQVLYLEAEAAGLRGTGIGCYFDDALHELVGLRQASLPALQAVYHFTVGRALEDPRVQSEPPYAHRPAT